MFAVDNRTQPLGCYETKSDCFIHKKHHLCTLTEISTILNRLQIGRSAANFKLDQLGRLAALKSEKSAESYYAAVFLEQPISAWCSGKRGKAQQRLQPVLFSCISQIKQRGGATRQEEKKKRKKRKWRHFFLRRMVSITLSCIINSCSPAFFSLLCSLALLEPMSLCMRPLGEHRELCTAPTVQSRESKREGERQRYSNPRWTFKATVQTFFFFTYTHWPV